MMADHEEPPECTIDNVLKTIASVSNLRVLGSQLGLETRKLDDIESDSAPSERRAKMVAAWFAMDHHPTWEKLHKALLAPALAEVGVAKHIKTYFLGSSWSVSVSTGSTPTSPTASSDIPEVGETPCTIQNVVNKIAGIKNRLQLGLLLGIPEVLLSRVEEYPVCERDQRLVEAWFKGDVSLEKLHSALQLHNTQQSSTQSLHLSNSEETQREAVNIRAEQRGTKRKRSSVQQEFRDENESEIRRKFATFADRVASKLSKKMVDMTKFHSRVVHLFIGASCIPKKASIAGTFEAISEKGLWDYENYRSLVDIVKMFGEGDADLESEIEEFEKARLKYLATIEIVSYIERCQNKRKTSPTYKPLPENYYVNYPSKLTINLEINITTETLEYVDMLWGRVAKFFPLPSLSAVLETISPGSILITWIITTETAQHIRENIDVATSFLREERITLVIIDGDCVYEEEEENDEELVIACRDEKLEKAKSLLEKGVDPNTMLEENGWSGIHYTARAGNHALLDLLIRAGADVSLANKEGRTALHLATEGGHTTVVEALVKAEGGCAINAQDSEFGDTALSMALKKKHLDIVRVLLKQRLDIDVNVVDKDDKSAVVIAAEMDCPGEILDALAEAGAIEPETGQEHVPVAPGGRSIFAPLFDRIRRGTRELRLLWSARRGKTDSVRARLGEGADPNYREKDAYQWTPLMWASNNGHTEVVRILLEKGADPNLKGAGNWNALTLASRKGHYEVVELLLDPKHGECDVNVQNTVDGWTALFWAAQCRSYLGLVRSTKLEKKKNLQKVTELLLKSGANPNIKAKNGWTPVMQASQDDHAKFIDLLKTSTIQCDPDYKTEKGLFALMVATLKNNPDVVNALCSSLGANPNLANEKKHTALHVACYKGYDEVVKQLVHNGADVNVQDEMGLVPLIMAIKGKHVNIVKSLCDAGADLNIQAGKYSDWTPIMFALKERDQQIVKCLKAKKPNMSIRDAQGHTAVTLAYAFNQKLYSLLTEDWEEDDKERIEKELREHKVSLLDRQAYAKNELLYRTLHRPVSIGI